MTTRILAWVLHLLLALGAATQAQAQPVACAAELQQPRPAMAHTLAALAQHEHAQMGGARIDAGGALVQSGFAEATREHLPGAELAAWQRVWQYWRAVPDFYAQHLAWLDGLAPTGLKRIALVDQPWSAAFISWLMREAGLSRTEFAFSASHHDYVRAAILAGDAEAQGQRTYYGWRACDVTQTPPRVGDLLCFARGAYGILDTWASVRDAVLEGALSMHCELVVSADKQGIATLGGNVVDTVVLRELELHNDGSGRLWPAYLQSAHRQQQRALIEQPPAGQVQHRWPQTHLSQQSWSMLLQLRSAAWPSPGG